jgi:hypothetical protein
MLRIPFDAAQRCRCSGTAHHHWRDRVLVTSRSLRAMFRSARTRVRDAPQDTKGEDMTREDAHAISRLRLPLHYRAARSRAVSRRAPVAALLAGAAGGARAADEAAFPPHPRWKFVFVNHVTANPFFVPCQYLLPNCSIAISAALDRAHSGTRWQAQG